MRRDRKGLMFTLAVFLGFAATLVMREAGGPGPGPV